MNKKNLLGLLLFACLITAGLFAGANYLTGLKSGAYTDQAGIPENARDMQNSSTKDTANQNTSKNIEKELAVADLAGKAADTQEPWLNANPTDNGSAPDSTADTAAGNTAQSNADTQGINATFSTSVDTAEAPQLILNSDEIDYMAYIPEIVADSSLAAALDISNPGIDVDAAAAILFDAETGKILYHKNAVQAVFPASTAKLLTALVALDWCNEDEEVTIGDEIAMIASDSTIAGLYPGEILNIRNLLNGMLLPSGNDAAYAIAAYVGRKSLNKPEAVREEAIAEFVRLMNQKAVTLGVRNSCFKTPDGYDAIGQYTTAYDMGMIGIAAAANETIIEVSDQGRSRNLFPSGEDVTWYNTNKLVRKDYAQYYSNAIGLKTGTSTMAGRCLVAAAQKDGHKVVCAIMDSSSAGRWEDALALLKYGLRQ